MYVAIETTPSSNVGNNWR